MSDSKYHAAITLLNDRFARKDLVVNDHMSKLLNLTPVKKSYDIAALRQLYDECGIQIRSLESASIHCDTYGSFLWQQLTRPNRVQRDAVQKPFNKTVPGSESRPKRLLHQLLHCTQLAKRFHRTVNSMTAQPISQSVVPIIQ